MQNGSLKLHGIIEGFASNGLKFHGSIDEKSGEITNFFPTLN